MTEHTSTRPRRQKRSRTYRPDLRHFPEPWEVTVRPAINDEGEDIHALVDAVTQRYGWTLPDCRWDRITPFWYVAEVGGYLVGAVQVCIGWPVARLELLSVRPGLSHTKTAKIVKTLVYHTLQAMHLDGSTLVSTVLPTQDEAYTRTMERYGFRFIVKGKMFVYDLAAIEKEQAHGISE